MTIAVSGLLLLIIVVVLATIGRDGLWSNAIALLNVIIAALVATNFWEPVTAYLLKSAPSYVYFWDIIALWGLFAATFIPLRLATDFLSRVRVLFPRPLDVGGGFVCALLVGWVMLCFTAMTLHTAPLSRNFLFDGFKPEEAMFFGLAPDRQWLGFVQNMSTGAFARGASAGNPEEHVFDPRGEFLVKYATRREILQKGVDLTVK